MLERVIALALLLFGLVWAASVLGTSDAPPAAPEAPAPPAAPDPEVPRPPTSAGFEPEPPAPPPREEPPPAPRPRSGLLGGLIGSPG